MIAEQERVQAATVEEVQDAVRALPRLLPRAGGSKTALSTLPAGTDAALLDLHALRGMVEYEPDEYTFTARAGTPLATIEAALAEHGQYLPFDPPLVQAGATLGGAIAAGLSGSRRHRFGGLRDFLLGVAFVDGRGRLLRGGGKVVKNAAGFDLPKLLIGSLGRLGILTEATVKVFPNPPAFATLRLPCATLEAARAALQALSAAPLDIEALDLHAGDPGTGRGPTLWVRLGSHAAVLPERIERLRTLLGGGEAVPEADEAALWEAARAFAWVRPGWSLARVATNPHRLVALDAALETLGAERRYTAGGHLAWVAWQEDAAGIDALLARLGLAGQRVLGAPGAPLLGRVPDSTVVDRIKSVLDPEGRFPTF